MSQPDTLVIYHGNCADGFTAAWAVKQALPEAELFAAHHGNLPPDCTDKMVVLVDFCYYPERMLEIQHQAYGILVLDHHASAEKMLQNEERTADDILTVCRLSNRTKHTWGSVQGSIYQDKREGIQKAIVYAIFDMERSGAGLAWDFFHPDKPRPDLVNYVEDRDLWKFNYPGSKEYAAALFSYEYDLDLWTQLAVTLTQDLIEDGRSILRKQAKDIRELLAVVTRPMSIGGHEILVANLPYTLSSDTGHILCNGYPFAACYWDTENHRHFSLRSDEHGIDVSEIAKEYGGGGHKHAAGFRVPRDHLLATY